MYETNLSNTADTTGNWASTVTMMIPPANIPPPRPLDMDDNLATNWKQWRKTWQRYEIATGIFKQEGLIRVATLLSVIGEQAAKVYDTFTWGDGQNEQCVTDVLAQFDRYCEPRTQVIYERYRFNNRNQAVGESISAYVTDLRTIARNCAHDDITPDQIIRDRLVLGLCDHKMRERLLRMNDLTLEKAIDVCKASEQTSAQLQVMQGATQDVSFVRKRQMRQTARPPHINTQQRFNSPKLRGPPEQQHQQDCRYCGRRHAKRECPAYGQTCRKCGKKNHFQAKCKATTSTVHTTEQIFFVGFIGDRSTNAVITMDVGHPRTSSRVKFQMDTGAECNVLPLKAYYGATGDRHMQKINRCTHMYIRTYTGERYQILGWVTLPVWRHGKQSSLTFNITNDDFTPLLSLKTCTAMGFLTINDSDRKVNSVSNTSGVCVPSGYSDSPQPAPRSSLRKAVRAAVKEKADLLTEFKDVFEGLGELPGEYHIVTDDSVTPVIHPPRRVPVPLRERVKEKLDEMVQREIIKPVTEPTAWVSSMLVVVKPDKLRICIDPRDLNRAICREHYQMPTIEEVATRLTDAKKFTVLDAKEGFWQKRLDEDSSYKTTFNTPFGRFRWMRMPFGICSAPEVWQRTMHAFVEHLDGVEVIADDFLIAGFGKTEQEVNRSLEENERAFFEKCREWKLKLNLSKVKRGQTSARFMGHILTSEGLKPDPTKISAITDMPEPGDVTALKRFLGMVNYLSKYLPRLSEMTEPLRKLDDKDVEFIWTNSHTAAMNCIKKLVTEAPVLRYYDVKKPVTIQCDSSEHGLGAVLMQEGQPVSYASRALTDTETRYAQIEKELLEILWSCDRFDQYIYGRDVVTIESDHEPLKAVFKKDIHKSPKRLQRMCLALQKYNLDVQYKRGPLMYISDTLSRAYRDTTEGSQFEDCEIRALETVNHENISVTKTKRDEFREQVAADNETQALIPIIQHGWPAKAQCPQAALPYYDERSCLIEAEGLVYRGEQIVVPRSLRKDMLQQIHSSHIGTGGCVRRAKEVLYWPGMSADVRDIVSRCSTCQTFAPQQCREPLQPHELTSRPWEKIGADLFELSGQTFIIMVDYWSNYFEVAELHKKTSQSVINQLKVQFARHGIPSVMMTDNGPEFASQEFKKFVKEWKMEHITSSPRYPQSNGKAENAVRTCKALFKKAREDRRDPLLALLAWRNTPSEHIGTSPVQRLMGRRTRTLLPTTQELLRPEIPPTTRERLTSLKKAQSARYNRGTKTLNELHVGDHIRMRLPGDRRWSLGQCRRVLGQRSYEVEVNGSRYRRNRRQLRSTAELPNMDTAVDDVESMHHQDETLQENRMTEAAEVHRGPESHDTPPRPVSTPRRPIGDGPGTPELPTPPVPKPQHSIRDRVKPKWQVDYEL